MRQPPRLALRVSSATIRLIDRARGSLASWIFEALYGSFALCYDRISKFFFAGQWSVWQRTALDHLEGGRVLELGYGTGDLALEMCSRGYEVMGVDSSPRMHRIARVKLWRGGCQGTLLIGSSAALPLSDGSVDAVVSTFPSSYILSEETWTEAWRVLRIGGSFVIVLSGRLLAVDHRSKMLIRFHSLIYGEQRPTAHLDWSVTPGFDLRFERHANAQGVADLLIARKLV